jgi:hypothetical protein
MEHRGLLQNRRIAAAFVIITGFTLLFLAANLSVLGGPDFFQWSNTILPPLAALTAAGLSLRASLHTDPASRRFWFGMALGFGLWGLADLLWVYYSFAYSADPPFPSMADALWLLAYPPIFYALSIRLRTLKVVPSLRQRWMVITAGVLGLLFTFGFIIPPILADFDPGRYDEVVINLAYPLADLGLAVMAALVLVLLKEGRFSLSWRLIFLGIFLMTASDLLFAFSTWRGLYYPPGEINALTIFTETSYCLAYVCSACGIFLYQQVWKIKENYILSMQTAPPAHFSAFLTTNRDDLLITASDNFHCLHGLPEYRSFDRQPLAQALGASPGEIQALIEQARDKGCIFHQPLAVSIPQARQPVQVWLTIMACNESEDIYDGSNIAVLADIPVPPEKRLPYSQEVQAMLKHLLARAGALPADELHALQVYFLETMRLLSSILYQFGGPKFSDSLFTELKQTITDANLPVRLDSQVFILPEAPSAGALAACLRPLLQTARGHVSNLVGPQIVAQELDELYKQFDPLILPLLEKHRPALDSF